MEAINPEDTHAVQIHSVDNIVNEIRQLTSKLQSSDAFNSSVRSPVAETQAFRSPYDSESQFFQPYKESVSRDPERSEDDMQSATKIQENVTKGLSLHSRLDQALMNSNQIQRQPSQGNATTEPFSATSQELNVRSDNITFNQGVRSSLPRPALQLSSRSEVLEKYSQGPPSMSRIPVALNAEAEFNNPFASARPSHMGGLKSPIHETPNYRINTSNNSPPISTGFQPSAHVSASNFFTQTVPSSTGLVDNALSQGYNRPPLGFSSVPQQEARPTKGIKIEDQAHHSASKPIYNKDKLDRILSGIKNRGTSPAPGISASLNIGASDRSQTRSLTSVGPMLSPTASQHSFQFDQRQTTTLPPSLDIPRLSHYGSVPQMRSDVFSPTNAFSQRNLNLPQYASYSTAGMMPTVLSPQNLVQSTAMHYPPHHHPTMFQPNNNYYAALSSLKNTDRKMPFTPSEGPLRTPPYANSRTSLQYNQQLPQTQGFHAELYDEEDSHVQETRQKPRKFASGRKGTGSKRKMPTRENDQGDVLWGHVENDDDSLVMGHFVDKDKLYSSKKPNQGAPAGFGALEEDVSYISRPSIKETPKMQAQMSQLSQQSQPTQQSQPRQRSTRRERSKQRNAKQQEVLQRVITDSILGSGPAIEEPVIEGRVERPRRNSRKPGPETEPEEQPEQPVYTAATATTVDKRDEFVATTKKSTYTQGMELRRGGSSQKLRPQERAKSPKIEHSSEFQLREESTIKNTRLLAELERGLEISGSSEIKKNTQPEMLNNGETLSDFEFKGSNIELVETPEQRGRGRNANEESPQRDEDSVTRAFEHAKLEKSAKRSPKKSPQRRVTREGVAMKTEMVFKGKTSHRKIVK